MILIFYFIEIRGARCSSVVRAFAHGAMGRRIDPSSQSSVTKVVRGMCYPVCEMVHIKEPLLLLGKSSPCGSSGFLSHYLSGSLPYVRRNITVNKMC